MGSKAPDKPPLSAVVLSDKPPLPPPLPPRRESYGRILSWAEVPAEAIRRGNTVPEAVLEATRQREAAYPAGPNPYQAYPHFLPPRHLGGPEPHWVVRSFVTALFVSLVLYGSAFLLGVLNSQIHYLR